MFLNATPVFAAEGGILIGSPNSHSLRPKGSEVVLIDFTVMECFRSGEEARNLLEGDLSLIKHRACGEGLAHVLMQKKGSMISGEDKKFTDIIQIPYIVNQPKIYVDKGHFKVRPIMKKHQTEKKGEVVISLSKIIKGHIKATMVASFESVNMKDHTAYYKEDQAYVNQIPVKNNRIMTVSETLKLGEAKIVSGDMWIENVKKKNNILPEHSRLWVDIKIK